MITPEGHHHYSIVEARRNFSAVIREVEAGRTVEISRHGVPVVAMVRIDSLPAPGVVRDRDQAEPDPPPEEARARDESRRE